MQFALAGMKGYFSFERAFKIIHSNSNLHTFSSLMGLRLQIGRSIYIDCHRRKEWCTLRRFPLTCFKMQNRRRYLIIKHLGSILLLRKGLFIVHVHDFILDQINYTDGTNCLPVIETLSSHTLWRVSHLDLPSVCVTVEGPVLCLFLDLYHSCGRLVICHALLMIHRNEWNSRKQHI